jgi:hypothetical protein
MSNQKLKTMTTAVICTSLYVIVAGAIAYFLVNMDRGEWSN